MTSMNKSWKVALVFAGVFLAGAVTGGFASLRLAKNFVQSRGSADQFIAGHTKRLNERLKLNAVQQAKIGTIVAETGEELKKLRRETGKLFQVMDARISAELDATQRKEFEEMQRRWRERGRARPNPPRDDREGAKREVERSPAPAGPKAPPNGTP